MIQEILDCLLIKAKFVLETEEELLSDVKEEINLTNICDSVCYILEHDLFFYTSPELVHKLEVLVKEKRFEGKHSKELVTDFNIIVDYINTYKSLDDDYKNKIVEKWIKKEVEERKLPRLFYSYDVSSIHECIKQDYYYGDMILNLKQDKQLYNPIYFLSTANYLCENFSEVFIENRNVLSYIYAFSLGLQKKVIPVKYHMYSKMAKKLEQTVLDIEEKLPEDNNEMVKYQLKLKLAERD